MAKAIQIIDPTRSFWDLHPHLAPMFPSRPSSTVMWALTLIYHPESPYADFTFSTKRDIVFKEYNTSDEELSPIIQQFKSAILTKPQKFLIEWEEKLEERQAYLHSLPYNSENIDSLDKAMANSEKLWKVYLNAKKEVDQEISATAQGGVIESAQEQGII